MYVFFLFGCIEYCLELLLLMLEMSCLKLYVRMNSYMLFFYLILVNVCNGDMVDFCLVINI